MPRAKKFKVVLLPLLIGLFLIIYCLHTPFPSSKSKIKVYSTHNHNDLHLLLTQAIKKAKKSLYLKTYALTDSAIISLLKKKSEDGVKVHLYYHKNVSPKLECLKRPNFYLHPIQEKGLMHEKIWIIDEKFVFLGSANITYSSLKMHENCVVGIFSPELAHQLITNRPEKINMKIENHDFEFYSLPNKNALIVLLDRINKAKSKISVSLFTFTHPLLVKKLIEMHQKGLKVSVTVDGYTAQGASRIALNQLKKAGVRTYCTHGPQLYHHKWALIDEDTLILGSANWTKAAFTKNKDFILILHPLDHKKLNVFKKANRSAYKY